MHWCLMLDATKLDAIVTIPVACHIAEWTVYASACASSGRQYVKNHV